jgi:uncharacterized Fe-S cluster-containing radical SAM superfamily protein
VQETNNCPLPFIHTYIKANGSLAACCESQEFPLDGDEISFQARWQGMKYEKLRQEFIQGLSPDTCKKCWANESIGLKSNRQEMIENLQSGFFGEMSDSFESRPLQRWPHSIELKLSNVCNLKCRMCHPSSSHRLWEDRDIHEQYRGPLKWNPRVLDSTQTIQQLFELGAEFFSSLRVVQFSGGEPLINDDHLTLVEELLRHNPQRCQLRYSTNLQQLSHRSVDFVELWKPFKMVNVKVSIDGIDEVYDYIRVGGQFKTLISNLEKLLQLSSPNLQVAIGFTTQAYNVFQLPEFLNFFERYIPRGQISTHWLHSPNILSVSALPLKYRLSIANKMRALRSDLAETAQSLEQLPDQPELWQRLLKYSEAMDTRFAAKESFLKIMQRYDIEV